MDEVSINDIVEHREIGEFPGYWIYEDGRCLVSPALIIHIKQCKNWSE